MVRFTLFALLACIALMLQLITAAEPQRCTSADTGKVLYYIAKPKMDSAMSEVALRDAVYAELGEIKRTAAQHDDSLLKARLAASDGAYDWMSTQAMQSGVPVYRWLGRHLLCFLAVDPKHVLYRDRGKAGVMVDWKAAQAKGRLPAVDCTTGSCRVEALPLDWFLRSYNSNVEAVTKPAPEW